MTITPTIVTNHNHIIKTILSLIMWFTPIFGLKIQNRDKISLTLIVWIFNLKMNIKITERTGRVLIVWIISLKMRVKNLSTLSKPCPCVP